MHGHSLLEVQDSLVLVIDVRHHSPKASRGRVGRAGGAHPVARPGEHLAGSSAGPDRRGRAGSAALSMQSPGRPRRSRRFTISWCSASPPVPRSAAVEGHHGGPQSLSGSRRMCARSFRARPPGARVPRGRRLRLAPAHLGLAHEAGLRRVERAGAIVLPLRAPALRMAPHCSPAAEFRAKVTEVIGVPDGVVL